MIKQYATLKVGSGEYRLSDESGVTILHGTLPIVHYIYQESQVFNILSELGWNFAFKINDNWYMMTKSKAWVV